MFEQIVIHKEVLERFLERISNASIDRAEVVAHATVSAFVHHWPSRSESALQTLLEQTHIIKETERSRWMTQRRLAVAKLAKQLT